MHLHHFTLRRLAEELSLTWQGAGVEACFSQDKNELVLETTHGWLRIGCNTPLSYVVPVESYARARKNVVDLFPGLPGKTLTGAYAVPYERILVLQFDGHTDLVLKMHGIRSNVLLRENGIIAGLFNQRQQDDLGFEEQPGTFSPGLPDETLPLGAALKALSPVFDKAFAAWMEARQQMGDPLHTAFEAALFAAQKGPVYVLHSPKGVLFSLFPPEKDQPAAEFHALSAGLQRFLYLHFQFNHYQATYRELDREIRKPYEKFSASLRSHEENLRRMQTERPPEELGHLIMAHLHLDAGEAEVLEVPDFYQEGRPIRIKINPKLTLQENATRYYQRQKERKKQAFFLEGEVEELMEKVEEAEGGVQAFMRLDPPERLAFTPEGFDPAMVRALKELHKEWLKEEKKAKRDHLPFRKFEFGGYQIWVGRNAANNDELSFHYAHREDTWLHAKDVTGSHVIVRNPSGKNLPAPVLEFAAQLAAYYSRLRNAEYVPVQYTQRKYVRKRKGDAPGAVAVDREEVILVTPQKPES